MWNKCIKRKRKVKNGNKKVKKTRGRLYVGAYISSYKIMSLSFGADFCCIASQSHRWTSSIGSVV